MKKYGFLLILGSILFSTIIRAESYSLHRNDDSFIIGGGRKKITSDNRLNSSLNLSEKENKKKEFSIDNLNFAGSKFNSQKGGNNEDIAARNSVSGYFSPEISLSYNNNFAVPYLIISPIVKYKEETHIKKEISKDPDFESIAGFILNSGSVSFTIEAGRGFQRLDSFGLFFSAITNFANTTFKIVEPNISFSLISASFDYEKKSIATSEKISNGNKLLGAGILFGKLPFLNWLNIFSYKLHEPMKIARKENFRFHTEDFHPLGNFYYSGLEAESKPIGNLARSDFGFITVKGYRDMGEYSYQKYNSRISTSGYIAYFQERFDLEKLQFRVGILKSSKDKVSRIDKESNGYAGLLTEPRIFGGRSSFLLNENIQPFEERIFGDTEEKKKPIFENKGLQISNLSFVYKPTKNIDLSVIFNHSISRIGNGKEFILLGQYQLDEMKKSFLLFSACVAKVRSLKQSNLLYNEIPESIVEREFVRFYFSGVFMF